MVSFTVWDDNDNGERPIDIDELDVEANDHTHQAVSATRDNDIYVGYHIVDRYDYEVYIEGGRFTKTEYFLTFDEARQRLKEVYPQAKWEDVGW